MSPPFGTEGPTLLAHVAGHYQRLVLEKGVLLNDTVHAIIVGEILAPDVEASGDMPATKVIISNVQHACLALLRSAATQLIEMQ
jgi:hypothetical protein